METKRFGRALAVLMVVALAATPARAQTPTGTLEGRILDRAGAPVAGATVFARSESGFEASTSTDEDGRFRMAALPAGSFRVRIEALSFRAAEPRVRIAGGETTALDLRLDSTPIQLSGVTVSATRTSAPVATIPGAVTLIEAEEIATQAALTPDMGGVLSQTVPGLSAGTQSMSIYGQSFRGRKVSVLIDGVPQSTSRNVLRDFATIDPSAVERVEVLHGATALYGDGATGGVINIVTRKPVDGTRYTTTVGVDAAFRPFAEGAGMRASQAVAGRQGALDYVLSGSWAESGSYFDADGLRIPSDPQGQGGVADYESWNVLGKLAGTFGERRIELGVNRYDGVQDTRYTSDPSVDAAEPRSARAAAISGLDLEDPQGSDNLNVTLGYRESGILGGQLRGQLFYRDYLTRFSPWDARGYLGYITQSYVDSEKRGGRVELEMALPVATAPTVIWGLDYTDETTFQGVGILDPGQYEQSGGLVFRRIGEKMWVPPIDSRSVAGFAQFGWAPNERLSLRGGLRHERVRMQVNDFETITGNAIEGGQLEYAPLLLNLGAVFSATEAVSVFAAYSQGFSLADIGRVLRGAPAGFSLGARDLQAQTVDHYEAGARAFWGMARLSASAFYNESDLGTGLNADLTVRRAPERIRGFEASAELAPSADLSFGGTFTWSEGESYYEDDDVWKALDGFRIQPLKVTLHGEHRTMERWTNRLQLLHSGSRDRAFRDEIGYGGTPIESYTVVDYLGRVDVGTGSVTVGVQNLLNAEYFTVISQLYSQFGNSVYTAARGRTLSLGYTVTY